MQLISDVISRLWLGPAQGYANLAVFPLLAQQETAADYLVLDDALAKKMARVTEVSEGGSVPELAFENLADVGVLLLDGEELVGARQNRILNISILVGAGKRVVIPVSCVEQGRWRYNSAEFASADRVLFSKSRASKARHVTASMRDSGERRSDQHEVWDHVAEKAARFQSHSDTGAMGDIYEKERARLDEYVGAVSARAGQCGAAFAIDGEVVGIELFDSPATFAKYLPKIVRSYAMDAAETAEPRYVPPVQEAVRRFIDDMQAAAAERFQALGEGEDVRLDGEGIAGGALVLGERIVHLAAFKVDKNTRLKRALSRRMRGRPVAE